MQHEGGLNSVVRRHFLPYCYATMNPVQWECHNSHCSSWWLQFICNILWENYTLDTYSFKNSKFYLYISGNRSKLAIMIRFVFSYLHLCNCTLNIFRKNLNRQFVAHKLKYLYNVRSFIKSFLIFVMKSPGDLQTPLHYAWLQQYVKLEFYLIFILLLFIFRFFFIPYLFRLTSLLILLFIFFFIF